jgi:hypothetical protein
MAKAKPSKAVPAPAVAADSSLNSQENTMNTETKTPVVIEDRRDSEHAEGRREGDAVAAAAVATVAAAAAPVNFVGAGAVKEGNIVKLATGERRVDYIKRRFAEGAARGLIAKELGVPYQIVFAATKVKPIAEATPSAGAAVQAAANAVATPAAAPTEGEVPAAA